LAEAYDMIGELEGELEEDEDERQFQKRDLSKIYKVAEQLKVL
jgi:hypothetical protein